MTRRNKEPRTISEVKGRAAASLVRLRSVASLFIYIDETANCQTCQVSTGAFFPILLDRKPSTTS
jgi:hypothetical protein